MKQIPEESIDFGKMSMEEFGLYLLGLESFQKCRGTLREHTEESLLVHILGSTNSPTAALKTMERHWSSRKIILNLAAKLKRAGEMEKLEELFRYLTIPNLLLPGETITGEALIPATVFMLDPERTMLAINWSVTTPEVDWYRYFLRGIAECELTPRMFELFPSIRERESNEWKEEIPPENHAGWLLGHAYCNDVLAKFRHDFKIDDGLRISSSACFNPHNIRLPANFWHYAQKYPLWFYGKEQGKDFRYMQEVDYEIGDQSLGRPSVNPYYAFMQKGPKKDVLKQFSRDEQKKLGVWEFHLPKSFAHYCYNYLIGFHPESEHKRWSKEWPLFASRNVNNGYGAILMVDPHDGAMTHYRPTTYADGKRLVPNRVVLEGWYDNVFSDKKTMEYRSTGGMDPIQYITRAKEQARMREAIETREKERRECGEPEINLLDFDILEIANQTTRNHRDSIRDQYLAIQKDQDNSQ